MMKTKMMCCVLVMCMTSACDDNKPAPPAPPEPPAVDEVDGKKPQEKTEAKQATKPEKVLDAKAARQVIDAWLESQNKGDFEAYSSTYASRLTGVKRVGHSRFQYDRAGWLKDRSRMFKKKVEVSLDDIVVTPSTQSVVVRGNQTWASGSFKDQGPKQFVLVPQGQDGALKIAREEMLASQLVKQDAKPKALGAGAIGLSMSGGRDDLLVWPVEAKSDWYDEQTVKSIKRGESAMAPALMDKLPADLKALDGRKVQVYGPDKSVCEMVIKGFSIVGEAVPHFGQVQYWDGVMQDDKSARVSDEMVGQGIMGLAEGGGLYVAANVTPTGDACKGWTWGSVKPSLKTGVFQPVKTSEDRKKSIAFFQSLPGYVQIQKDYTSRTKEKKPWSAQGTGPQVHRATIDGRAFVLVHAFAGTGCDTGFFGEFWALFEDKAKPVLLSDGKSPGGQFPGGTIDIHSVVDVDGDGTLEFIGPMSVVQAVGPVWHITHTREVPFLDCPC